MVESARIWASGAAGSSERMMVFRQCGLMLCPMDVDVGVEVEPSEHLPSGTVTFVLADIVGSTAMWEASPAATAEAVAALEGLVDSLVGEWRGVRPLEQGEGDSFVAAFGIAVDAARFAIEL